MIRRRKEHANNSQPGMNNKTQDNDMLDKLQKKTFGYFLHETNPANGLVIDKTAHNWPARPTAR